MVSYIFFEFIKPIDNKLTTLQQEVKFNLYIKCITLSIIIEFMFIPPQTAPVFLCQNPSLSFG